MSFDRFMVSRDAASNPKVKRMKRAGKETRWAWFHGVLAIAARSNPRGYFTVGGCAADEHDVADIADVTLAEARRALKVGRELGMLLKINGEEFERVHDWDTMNPAPLVDKTGAERQARRRAQLRRDEPTNPHATRDSATPVTRDVTDNSRDVTNGVTRDVTRDVTENSRDASRARAFPPKGGEVEVEEEGEVEEKQQQQRAHTSELVEEVANILDSASSNGPIERTKLADLIDGQPMKDHRAAALETVAWAEREALQSVVNAYQHVLSKRPTVAPPPPEPEAPTAQAAAKWETARTVLRADLAEGLFDLWIEPIVLLGVVDEQLVLGATAAIQSWVADRFVAPLDEALGDTPWRIDAIKAQLGLTTTTMEAA